MSISGLNIASRLDVTCIPLLPFQPGGKSPKTNMICGMYGMEPKKENHNKIMFQTFADFFGFPCQF